MNNRKLGVIVAIAGVILLILILSLAQSIQSAAAAECACSGDGLTCPHSSNLPFQVYIGVGLAIVLFFLSYNLITKKEKKPEVKKEFKIPENLSEEERSVIDELIKEDGVIFQSELVEKLGVPKVKVTRLLDKLEGKGLIERRRRGMTNAVILKRKE